MKSVNFQSRRTSRRLRSALLLLSFSVPCLFIYKMVINNVQIMQWSVWSICMYVYVRVNLSILYMHVFILSSIQLFIQGSLLYMPGIPKKRNGRFSVPCDLKVSFFASLNKTSSAEENDTKLIEFGWVILILCPFLETQPLSNFAWFLRPTTERRLCREWPFICPFPLTLHFLLTRINGFPKHDALFNDVKYKNYDTCSS